jgi:mannosyltransferase
MRLREALARHSELWAPAALALALCCHGLTARALWFDEHASWWAASMPFSAQQKLFAHLDLAIAPYYLLLKAWISLFGDSPALLRLPSALAMSLSAALLGRLGSKLFGPTSGLVAGLLFAATPSVTRYGQEVRVYAFVVALALLATLALLRAVADETRTRNWIAYAATLVALGLAHPPALCLIAAHMAALIAAFSLKPLRILVRGVAPWCSAVLAALFALAPMLWFASAQAAQIAWNNPDYDDLIRYPSQLFLARRLPWGVLPLALLSLLRLTRARFLLACWALVPPLLFFVTRSMLHLFLARYLLFTLPAWLLLSAVGLEDVAQRVRRRRAVVVLATASLVALGLTAQTRTRSLVSVFDHRAAGALIRSAQLPGDAIAFGGSFKSVRHGRLALRYELREQPPRDIFAAMSLLENADFVTEECQSTAACLPADVKRLWFVTSAGADDPWAGLPSERAETLIARFDVVSYHAHKQANVFLLARKL